MKSDRAFPEPRLGPVDRAFLAMGRHPASDHDLHNVYVLRLPGAPPALGVLRRHVSERVASLPELTCRLGVGGRRWTIDSSQEIAGQIDSLTVPPGGVAALEGALLGRDLPGCGLWSLTSVHGYSDEEYALCFSSHHALQDAGAAMHTLRVLFGTAPDHACRRFRPLSALQPVATATVATDLAVSLLPARWAGEGGFACSTASGRRISGVQVEGARLHAVARRTRVSVNDVFVALVASALTKQVGLRALHACVPLDLRLRGEQRDGLGNCVGMIRVALPTGGDGPALAAVHRATEHARSSPYRAALRALHDLSPSRIGMWITRRLLDARRSQLIASYVTFPWGLAFAGRPVRDAFALSSPLLGQLCASTLSVFGGRVRVGFVTGKGTPDLHPQCLADTWCEELASLESRLGEGLVSDRM
ncbi:WS/DGAT domain-containing protein [Streptomyces beigongshangae]|uniref:WS/DGAT domain-containing protein n=1 Tax=Streptomyces beigongshangae TaxID=2841597 RepID=UPI001C86199B|nr:WS/DGAT domain-containing protein [Streptomyces sp. REN17]